MRKVLYRYICNDGFEYLGEGFLAKDIYKMLAVDHKGIKIKIVYATCGFRRY